MRVVSGNCKGLSLKAVPGMSTRPTTDKVKEAMFNIIGPYFEGGLVLDLFGGSGGLGIEALSRGIDRAIFVDREAKAIKTIKENLVTCKLADHAEVYRNDAERAIKAIVKRELQFDLILLDPPYKDQKIISLLRIIDEHNLLHKNGTILIEHATDVELPAEIGNFTRRKAETYGICAVTVYRFNEEV
ncbi:16S rRNA (guanine(966)-N(2))-methyltransferase RsmD [Bacillus sp. RG28]|uniref:16S rRNA (Guanine(966)-N(2))-methyltransferase RsmD n=1 Tax=Gottfriedia endophytica TaxID=2820819 RepID=A0A940NNQ8_9BACI|nr:16S rRNA (guanine(966)-N(2))-methyltransferase RsmD [Gottfriedia endophytica]MBP0724793.1 16S rRNA (guanine(966)-N(2))-methyltransferase RsmD [Gottfriedia endophytica]